MFGCVVVMLVRLIGVLCCCLGCCCFCLFMWVMVFLRCVVIGRVWCCGCSCVWWLMR